MIGKTQVGGTDAVQVQGTSQQGDTVSAWIATGEPHHVLRLADGQDEGASSPDGHASPL